LLSKEVKMKMARKTTCAPSIESQRMLQKKKKPMSKMRKIYMARFVFRCVLLVAFIVLYFVAPEQFAVLEGWNFFKSFSALHVFWVLLMYAMIRQLISYRGSLTIGSQKNFKANFQPPADGYDKAGLRAYIKRINKGALLVLGVWSLLIASLSVLYVFDILEKEHLFLISVAFYLCDLICVLFFCPFRLMMKTRCCTTCRIFNWDHFMMVTPMLLVGGFFAVSLLVMAIVVLVAWEICILVHPERFWDRSNTTLRCSSCTDKLCTHLCGKCKKKK